MPDGGMNRPDQEEVGRHSPDSLNGYDSSRPASVLSGISSSVASPSIGRPPSSAFPGPPPRLSLWTGPHNAGRVVTMPTYHRPDEGSEKASLSSNTPTRKPVQRRTVSETSPQEENIGEHSRQASLSPSIVTRARGFRAATTSTLLSQASRSLTSLAGSLHLRRATTYEDSPPPYQTHGPSNLRRDPSDIKRREFISTQSEPTDLLQVVRDNRPDLLRRMLERGVNIDDADPRTKRTAIMEAAALRFVNCAQMLLHAGCRVHLKDVDGNTALHFAASQGDAEICRLILEADALLDDYNTLGETPTQLAARAGHTEAVLVLLNSWTVQRAHGSSLLTGFVEATKSGNITTAEVFVERGVRPKKVDNSWRLVANAAESGSIPMIDFLLLHKVSLKQQSPEGWTGLHFAAAKGHTAMVEKLLSWKLSWTARTKSAKELALHLAVLGQHHATAMALIMHKDAKITMEDADGNQPIHHAARIGDTVLVNNLLNQGVLKNLSTRQAERNKYGWSPLLLACAYGHLHLVAEFMTRGVSLEERLDSPSFETAKKTNESAKKGYWAEIRWPHVGARALHLALEFGQDEVANMLIVGGVKIDESDSQGWRPLHYAAFSGREQMVQLLLSKGASPHATTGEGNTPLTLGFREIGSSATYEEKVRINEMLQMAMHSRKLSKLKKMTSMMNTTNVVKKKSKEVQERNRIWHLAGLADALYQSGVPGPGDDVEYYEPEEQQQQRHQVEGDDQGFDDRNTMLSPTFSVQPSLDDRFDEETLASPMTMRGPRLSKLG